MDIYLSWVIQLAVCSHCVGRLIVFSITEWLVVHLFSDAFAGQSTRVDFLGIPWNDETFWDYSYLAHIANLMEKLTIVS